MHFDKVNARLTPYSYTHDFEVEVVDREIRRTLERRWSGKPAMPLLRKCTVDVLQHVNPQPSNRSAPNEEKNQDPLERVEDE